MAEERPAGSGAGQSAAPHAVLMPYPVQGQIIPMTQLAKALARHGIRVTLVHNRHTHALLTANQVATRVPLLQHTWVENGLPADFDYTDLIARMEELYMATLRMREPFRELLLSLARDQSAPATCVVGGTFCPWALTVACELGIPSALFWTQSAAVLDIYHHYPLLESHGFFPYSQFTPATGNDSLTQSISVVDYIPGVAPLQPSDVPSILRVDDTTHPAIQALIEQANSLNTCKHLVINSFYELEREACDALYHALSKLSIHLVGPLLPLAFLGCEDAKDTAVGASLFEEKKECIKWLDMQRYGSVLYVSFGSVHQPSLEDYETIALGVKASKQPFLWVIKPASSLRNPFDALPPRFQEETQHVGMVVPWAPQLEVLSHPSIGAFLSHCGWNSTLESISMGVPILPFPGFLDQPTNCSYITDVWEVGLKIKTEASGKVSKEEVSRVVRMILCEEEGKKLQKRARKLKEDARKAAQTGGTSYNAIESFVEALKCTC